MARKSSDLFTLLQSRGGGRGASGRPGILGQVTGWLSGLFSSSGSSKRRYHDGGGRRAMQFSSTALLGIVIASLGVGYLLGDAFPLAGKAALRRGGQQDPGPVRPGVIKGSATGLEGFRLSPETECTPVTSHAFALVNFGENGRSQASELALQLRAHGVESARPYLLWKPGVWLAVAYYGAENADTVRQQLLAVADLADHPEFGAERKRIKDWPPAFEIR